MRLVVIGRGSVRVFFFLTRVVTADDRISYVKYRRVSKLGAEADHK